MKKLKIIEIYIIMIFVLINKATIYNCTNVTTIQCNVLAYVFILSLRHRIQILNTLIGLLT